jgi:hypothetical protein
LGEPAQPWSSTQTLFALPDSATLSPAVSEGASRSFAFSALAAGAFEHPARPRTPAKHTTQADTTNRPKTLPKLIGPAYGGDCRSPPRGYGAGPQNPVFFAVFGFAAVCGFDEFTVSRRFCPTDRLRARCTRCPLGRSERQYRSLGAHFVRPRARCRLGWHRRPRRRV